MNKLTPEQYKNIIGLIDPDPVGGVYPLSAAEGRQQGDIYTDSVSVLIHHHCGFAFLFGKCDTAFLNCVYDTFLSPESEPPRRFVLFSDSERIVDLFRGKNNIIFGKRYFFSYPGDTAPKAEIPAGYSVRELDEDLCRRLEGRIVPAFSWSSTAEFLNGGKGFCVCDGDRPVAWAFSAAVSSREIDTGVETLESHRGQGLAYAAASQMISFCLEQGKRPVWACDAGNTASRRLAEKLGFVLTGECTTIRRQ
ncbi:MAG: GNAT family N-acetyltransferase [Ruminococcus sp.]|nr:GNAT family N-acetyltransferase [Ruminococcus sp.]